MFEIYTDSGANLPERIIRKYNITVVPFTYSLDGREYLCYEKGKRFDYDSYYRALREKKMIRTSMVNMQTFLQAFENKAALGVKILYIGFSSALSGTFNAAKTALSMLKSKYNNPDLYAVDTLSGSFGEGLCCYYAARMREEGLDIEKTAARISGLIPHLRSRFTCDDLFYIKRGGRISSATAVAGTLLGIKPVMKAGEDGKITLYEKVRGRKNALDKLIDELTRSVDMTKHQIIAISHADCEDDAKYMLSQLKNLPYISDVLVEKMEPVTAAHGGPGMIALFYFAKTK